MSKIALFGDSYIKRLEKFCGGFLGIPGDCRFYGVGGMRADNPHEGLLREMLCFKPNALFICLGGNDITADCSTKEIFDKIVGIVSDAKSVAEHVYICEIMTRGIFRATGLRKKEFDKKRRLLNRYLRKTYGQYFVTFSDIRYPTHYDKDRVHLSTTTEGTVCGMKKFQCRISRILCRH